jgi:hypothetical protein
MVKEKKDTVEKRLSQLVLTAALGTIIFFAQQTWSQVGEIRDKQTEQTIKNNTFELKLEQYQKECRDYQMLKSKKDSFQDMNLRALNKKIFGQRGFYNETAYKNK